MKPLSHPKSISTCCLLLFAFCFLLSTPHANAQPATGRGHWQKFGLPDGLASIRVTTIVQNGQGYLWFGTDGWGVSRYDGVQLKTYTTDDGLPSNHVNAIIEDQNGLLWVLTRLGACQYVNGEFQRVTIIQSSHAPSLWEGALAEDHSGSVWIGSGEGVEPYGQTRLTVGNGLVHNRVNTIMQAQSGAMWFGTNGGISRYETNQFVSFTTEHGLPDTLVTSILETRNGKIWIGTLEGAARYDPVLDTGLSNTRPWTVFTTRNGLNNDSINTIIEDTDGTIWFGTDKGVSRYDPSAGSEPFTTFTVEDGLVNNRVYAISEDHEGYLWFGTDDGVSRYDRGQCVTFTSVEGITKARVTTILEDRSGALWFGTNGGGVTQYQGNHFKTLTTRDGLADNHINTMFQSQNGNMWFGTNDGTSRYNQINQRWQTFSPKNGLPHKVVNMILEDRQGLFWFATNGGLSRYDGKRFNTFTFDDGLAHNVVWQIMEDENGHIWCGTAGGVSRYDGQNFTTWTTEDGLPHNAVWGLLPDRSGGFWFVTQEDGVCRYDGQNFIPFTRSDGLAGDRVASALIDRAGIAWFGTDRGVSRYNGKRMVDVFPGQRQEDWRVKTMLEDNEGHLWLGTQGAGVIHFYGNTFQRLFRQDGLTNDTIDKLYQDSKERIWIATPEGITRYHHRQTEPPILLTNIITDQIQGIRQDISLPTSQPTLRFEYLGVSFKTRADQMGYMYQLEGYDEKWQWTRDRAVTYSNLPRGDYIFRIKAVDRDLGLSAIPIEVSVAVHMPYEQILYMGLLGLVICIGLFAFRTARQRRHERDTVRRELMDTQQQLVVALKRELQAAHDMQMSLIPQSVPHVTGFDIAGECIPSSHVGGDHYTYRWLDDAQTQLAIVVADVAGKEMKAAMTVMRFTEVLHYEAQDRNTPKAILTGLNHSIRGRLERRLYVTACVGVLDVPRKQLTVSCAGHPPVYHRTDLDDRVTEIEITGHPLGIRPDADYEEQTVSLHANDIAIFYSDGIYEAQDHMGRTYGFDRLQETIRRAGQSGSAEEILERILTDVRRFAGRVTPEDDMTLVVVKAD